MSARVHIPYRIIMAVCIQIQSIPIIGIFTEEPCNYRIIKPCPQIILPRYGIPHLITCIVIIRPCPLTVGGKQFVSSNIADMYSPRHLKYFPAHHTDMYRSGCQPDPADSLPSGFSAFLCHSCRFMIFQKTFNISS